MNFRNILLSRLVKHIGEYCIRKYSLFCRATFLLVPTASSSLPRRRDFLSEKGKHANHKRRFRKTLPPVLQCELYIQQTLRRNHTPSCNPRSPTFPKFARRGRSYVSCLLSAQLELTSSSGVLRRVPFIASMKSPEKRAPCAYGE